MTETVKGHFSIDHVLWRGVPNHYPGHVHVDFSPQGYGTPAPEGGPFPMQPHGGWGPTGSPAERAFAAEAFKRFPELGDLGMYVRRPIAGSSTWSQHAYGNARDFDTNDVVSRGDALVAWILGPWEEEMTAEERVKVNESRGVVRYQNTLLRALAEKVGAPVPAGTGPKPDPLDDLRSAQRYESDLIRSIADKLA